MSPSSRLSETRAARLLMAEGFLGEIFVSLSGGVFLTGLALNLGAGPMTLALLVVLPFVAQLGALLAHPVEQRLGSRRGYVVPAISAARVLWAVPVVFATFGQRGAGPLVATMAALFLMAMVVMMGVNGWTSWMAEIIPPHARARLFARRSWAVGLSTLLSVQGGALFLDHFKRVGRERLALAVMGGVAILAGVSVALVLRRFPDAAPHPGPAEGLVAAARRLLRRKRYRRVFAFLVAWSFAVGVPSPFWNLYMLSQLKMTFFLTSIHTSIVLVVRLLVNGPWSRVIDRVGSQRVLLACALGISLTPFIWASTKEGRIWPVWIEACYSGVLWTGFNQAAFIQPIAVLSAADRGRGLAVLNLGTGVSTFAAGLLGGLVTRLLGVHRRATFVTLFVSSSVLRAITGLFALRLGEPGVSVRAFLVNFIGYGFLRRNAVGRQWILVDEPEEELPEDGDG
ncbi:MAG: hypothetical protein IT371_16150 [Deltaproteobacteria bacterium]|nr:hypothetical protein [Deltaproteobacteria bacterium]